MEVILFTDVAGTQGYGKYAGTYKIATEIRKNGYTCQVIDNFSFLGLERLKTLLDKFVTDETFLIGFSCTLNDRMVNRAQTHFQARNNTYFSEILNWGLPTEEVEDLISYAKKLNPNIKTCAGGAKISRKSDYKFIDYCVVGKADNSIIALLSHLKFNTDIKLSKNEHSYILDSADYFYTQSEYADSKIIYEDSDIILPGEVLPFEVGRGCIFSCAFCTFDLIGKRQGDWTKTAKNIREELLENYERFGTTTYNCTDELINESVEKLEMLCEATNNLPFKLKYSAYARVDLIHRYPEMRELLLESGAICLSFGIETFNHAAGKAVGKGLHPDKVKETLEFCKETWKNKILMSSGFIIGLPGETEESLKQTFEYLMSEQNPLDLFCFTVLQLPTDGNDCKIQKNPEKYGYTVSQQNNGISWKNDIMDLEKAKGIGVEFYKNPNIVNRTKFPTTTLIGRILSVGYSIDEIFEILNNRSLDVEEFRAEIRNRTGKIKNKYYDELLKLRVSHSG